MVVVALAASLLTAGVSPAPTYAAPLTCAQGGECAVGDIGPGGGVVFYVSATPFSCGPNHADDCKYLEAAPKNWKGGGVDDPTHYFKSYNLIVNGINQNDHPVPGILHDTRASGPNMNSNQIGLGLKNSIVLSDFDTSTSNAAVASRNYTGGSKNDWYLPTLVELRLLCQFSHGQTPNAGTACDYTNPLNTNVASAYQFASSAYISSSSSLYVWKQNFTLNAYGTGEQNDWGYSSDPFPTRPIRAFAPLNTLADGNTSCGGGGTFTILNKVVTTSSADCSGSVTIPYGVAAIADAAFYLRQITSISLPNTVATIGDSALRHTLMTTISIPGSVQSIGFLAFGTTYLSSITIPTASNLTTIGAYAFQSSVFTSITLPASVTTMGAGVFQLNNNLTSVVFSGVIPSGSPWDAPAGLNTSGRVLCGTNGYFAIQSNAVIGRHNCRGSVVIPEGVTAIGLEAFDADPGYGGVGRVGGGNLDDSTITTQITSVTIPSTLTAIGDYAFRHSRLTSLTIPESVTSIGIYAFAFSTQITSLTLGSSLTSIGNAAFADLAITSLTIPDGVTTIGGDAFVGTSLLTTVNYCGNANLAGTGLPNPSTNAGTCLPASPQSLVATGLNQSASIAFTAGASFGATITNYQYSIDGGSFTALSPADTTTPVVVPGLTNGTSHSIRLRAVNARGVGAASLPVSVTPKSLISVAAIGGVTAPVVGATPVTAVSAANGYTGTVSWSGSPTTFSPTTTYTATITLTPDSNYTLSGVAANFFTVAGATSATHSANSGTITAVFPATQVEAPAFTISSAAETVTAGTTLTGYTITSTGGTIASYSIAPGISNTPGLAFNTSTGLISGTPTTAASARTYTITAMNATTPNATATFTVRVSPPPPPTASIGTTTFAPGSAGNLGVTLGNFEQTQRYQVTVKFVNASTNVEVTNGTLTATQGSTSLISGYTSFSGTKLGFSGTYAAISTALSTVTWNPATTTNGISIRIGISSAPATNEFYDANSGHYYRFVATPQAWLDARTEAERTYLYGLQGYLAEINSEAENTFIAKETSAANIWIGAREDSATALNYYGRSYNGSVGQRWTWNGAAQSPLPVGTGEIAQSNLAAYSSWSQSEPNNDTRPRVVNNETIAGLDCAVTNWRTRGLWNDLPCGHGYGYLIEFGGRVNEVSTASSATLTETLTAANPVQYTITYNPNSGNSTPTQASRTRGQTFNLANAITRSPSGGTSYQFAGWESSSKTYSAGETITVGTANLTFTANWIQLYEVTYISNGGTFAGSETSKDAECASNICSNNQAITLNEEPTRAGYQFNGWMDQSSNIVSDSDPATASIQISVTSTRYIFSAVWSLINYTVTYISSGSTAPTQSALNAGQTFTVGAEVTKTSFRFEGWSDGSQIYWTNDDYQVQSSNITLTAQWRAVYTITYSVGSGSGTPPVDESTFFQGNTFEVEAATGLSKSGATFSGWSDGANIFQPGARYTIATSNVTLTARWGTESNSSNVVAAPAAALRAVTSPKITRDSSHYICISGTFLLVRNGSATEAPTLSLQKFSLIQDGKVVESIESTQSEIKFEIKSTYLNSTMSCSVQVGQESALSSFSSLSAKVIADANKVRKAAEKIADSQFYRDRTAALMKRSDEFKRIDQSKMSNAVAAKSAATKLWREEIQKATADRDAAREAAQGEYLRTLEKSGVSIYPQEAKTVVKPTPSLTPTTNPQPVAQMEKVGTVYMASGSYFLNDATKESLRAVAKKINASGAKSILVYGHADNRGGVDNTALSRNRARAVAAFIRTLLNTKKIAVGWFSSKKPVSPGTTEADLALNRRVEIYSR